MTAASKETEQKPECGSCRFAALFNVGTVECRRFPPAPHFEPMGGVSNIRPRVGAYYWCGEFVEGPGPDQNTYLQHRGRRPRIEIEDGSVPA